MPERYCTNCGHVGRPERFVPGSLTLEILLWLFLIFPGVIYSGLRRTRAYEGCPKCRAPHMIPLDSPRAAESPAVRGAMLQRAAAPFQGMSDAALGWSVIGGLVFVLAAWFGISERACPSRPTEKVPQAVVSEEEKRRNTEFDAMTAAQHLDRARALLKPGATREAITEGYRNLRAIPQFAPEAAQAKVLEQRFERAYWGRKR